MFEIVILNELKAIYEKFKTTPGLSAKEIAAYQSCIDEIEKIKRDVFYIEHSYLINVMRNGVSIGAMSGKNLGASGGGPPTPPVNTGLPIISDTTPTVNQVLTCTDGTWTNSPSSFSYQWYSGASPVGTNSNTFTPTTSQYNTVLTVKVVATNSDGSANATSSGTSAVLPLPPSNTVLPTITGITEDGQTLTCSTGTWSSQGTPSYARQWQLDGVDIVGETSSTYLAVTGDVGHDVGCRVRATNTGGATDAFANEVTISASGGAPSLSDITSNHVYSGSDRAFIYLPPGYYDNSNDYPVIFFGHGNGERGVPVDSFTNIGTANGVTTLFSTNLSNTDKILHSSVYLTVNGVQVATGRFGVISGTGVTGSYNYDDGSSASVSVTFSSAPSTGTVRVYFTQSNLLSQGPLRYLNLGDEPNVIYVIPQISRPSGGFEDTEWTTVIDYLLAAGYRVDLNRLYGTGLSLGGGLAEYGTFNNTGYQPAASVIFSPGSDAYIPAGGSEYWTRTTNRGKFILRGTSDPNGAGKVPSMMANGNGPDREFPVRCYQYWGLNHNSSMWDTKGYNRKNRTDATGTADFDYIEELLLPHSLDLVVQAQQHVDIALASFDSGHYRIAKRQVNNLSTSPEKTAMLLQLADSTYLATKGKSVIIDVGTSFRATSGSGVNNLTSAAAGATAKASDGTTNLKDEDGTSTGFTCTLVAATDASPSMIDDIGTVRVNGRQHGFELYTNRDGMRVDAAGTTGTITFGGLNNSDTYTLKIYVAASFSTWSNRAEAEATFGGATKYLYCDTQNMMYIKFTGLSPSSNAITGTLKQRLTASTERLFYLQALELIKE